MRIEESKSWTRHILSLMVVYTLSCSAGVAQNAREQVTAIENVTVISPERQAPLLHTTVVIAHGRISQVGTRLAIAPNIKRIDGRGKFLIPGLIDSHVHVGDTPMLDDEALAAHPELAQAYHAQVPRAYLAFGFTTLVDLNLRSGTLSWFGPAPVHPELFHCGPAVRVAGGYGALQIPKNSAEADAKNLVYEPAADALRAETRRRGPNRRTTDPSIGLRRRIDLRRLVVE